jgi:serine/threonine-protein kinase
VSASSEPRIGEAFAGYRIDAQAGHGGMGVVYRATHVRLDRTVALKLIAPALADDPAFAARFEREWRLLAALEHPNVIPVYEAGEVDGRLYLAMRWVAGGDLARRLRGTAGLEAPVAVELLAQVAAALDAAHARGVVHRDVKPANVLLDGDHAWLTDFGAGKDLAGADPRTAPGRWIGTADYVAPELLDGIDPTPAADVYSLGCVLFETLTGRVPFPRDTEVATLWAHRHEPPPSPTDERPGLPAALDDVLRRMLAKDPAERPASAGEALRAARAAITAPPSGRPTVVRGAVPTAATGGQAPPAPAGMPPPAPDPSPPEAGASAAGGSPPAPTSDPRARRRLALAAAAIAGLLAVVIAVLAVLDDDPAARRVGNPSATASATATATATATASPPHRVRRIWLSPNSKPGSIVAGEHTVHLRFGTDDLPPADIALSEDGTTLWASTGSRTLLKETPERIVHETETVDIDAVYLAVRGEDLFAMARNGRLQRVSPDPTAPLKLQGAPADLEAGEDGVVALMSDPPRLLRIAPDAARVEDTIDIEMEGVPDEVAVTGDDAWITDSENHRVVRLDATSGDVRDTFEIEGEPDAITSDGKVVYVAVREGTVERFDAETAERLRPIDARGPLGPDIDIGPDGTLWISGGDDDAVQIEFDQG